MVKRAAAFPVKTGLLERGILADYFKYGEALFNNGKKIHRPGPCS
jgi:hypothetical protein